MGQYAAKAPLASSVEANHANDLYRPVVHHTASSAKRTVHGSEKKRCDRRRYLLGHRAYLPYPPNPIYRHLEVRMHDQIA